MALFDPTGMAAFAILRRELGFWRAVKVGWTVENRTRRGDPFTGWSAPDDTSEAQSREQLGPALVLFEELCRTMESEQAKTITAMVVEAGAHIFLKASIGVIRKADLMQLDQGAREAFVAERMDRFPNATVTWDSISANHVSFRVTDCRFVRLCNEAGHPDLAPIFCAGDATYFGSVEPGVTLERPTTIAEGGSECPFTLRFAESGKTPD